MGLFEWLEFFHCREGMSLYYHTILIVFSDYYHNFKMFSSPSISLFFFKLTKLKDFAMTFVLGESELYLKSVYSSRNL